MGMLILYWVQFFISAALGKTGGSIVFDKK
jgi:hypothetical protein